MDYFNYNSTETQSPSRFEIKINNLHKRIHANYILNGISLQVERGQIYAVLGPSGCGKTTLLRCILGTTQYDDGDIFISSKRRTDIGYMPQELALQKDLTIEETFDFFGSINELSKKEIKTRMGHLVQLLDLPSVNSTLISLSSGEQRRVSLGVALIHNPQIVILDEPTVGLDPLLRNRIWNHLIYLTEIRYKTVIITTHYVEEAKHAHMIRDFINKSTLKTVYHVLVESILNYCILSWGSAAETNIEPVAIVQKTVIKIILKKQSKYSLELCYQDLMVLPIHLLFKKVNQDKSKVSFLRFGKFIEQKPPLELILEHKCSNLEEVFLKLAEVQDGQLYPKNNHKAAKVITEYGSQNHKIMQTTSMWSYQRFKAQLLKNITWQKRNKGILVFLILLPGLLSYLSNEVLKSDVNHIPVAVVIEDITTEACNLTLFDHKLHRYPLELQEFSGCALKTTDDVCSMNNWTCHSSSYSCLYLSVLSKETIILSRHNSLEDGKRSVQEGTTIAVIYFNANFSHAVEERFSQGLGSSNEIIDIGTISVWMDMTNAWVGAKIKSILAEASRSFLSVIVNKCETPSLDISSPIKIEKPIYGSLSSTFIHHSLPGLLCLFCFYLPMMFTQSSVLMEKKSGQIERSMASGLSLLEILAAHGVVQALLCTVQNIVIMSVCYIIYYNPQCGNWALIFLVIILIEALGASYGLLLSVSINSERLSTYAAVGTMVCLLCVLGVIWPNEGMHPVIMKALWTLPVVPALHSYRAIALKGWTLANTTVALGLIQTVALTALFLIATSFIIKIKNIFN